MGSWIVFSLLACIGAVLPSTHAQLCNLDGGFATPAFPDIEKEAALGYTMSVEYTAPKATQTDYFTEYYDVIERKGRVDSHEAGETSKYIYSAETYEAWEITNTECNLRNLTNIAPMLRDFQTDWFFQPPDAQATWRVGPSAMFKYGRDAWDVGKDRKMAYMGNGGQVRGLETVKWRHCINEGRASAEYYFAKHTIEFGEKILKSVPMRVVFEGPRGDILSSKLDKQTFDILNYQPFNTLGSEAFELPTDKACNRGVWLDDLPEVPNFEGKDLMFSSEVIYRKVDKTGAAATYWSYYSNLFYAYDHFSNHSAYHHTEWEGKKKEDQPLPPIFTVFDLKNGYSFDTDLGTAKCEISRKKNFYPSFNLPEGGGSISLTDFSILFPRSESTFVTEATNRGLKVNVFEDVLDGFLMKNKDGEEMVIPNAVITHSYLQDNEIERATADTKNALVQIQIKFSGRYDKIDEVITMNFYGFSTELRNQRSIFNIKRCFKNNDDYSWVTIGFHADPKVLQKIKQDIPIIEESIYTTLTMNSELNAVRMPIIMVNVETTLNVMIMILEKPSVILDYVTPIETDKYITKGSEVDGMEDMDTCAQECLENRDNCWGFSICGTICTYGVGNGEVVDKAGCQLYRRYNNESFIFSMDSLIESIKINVAENLVSLMVRDTQNKMVQLDAVSVTVTQPREGEDLFDRVGHKLNDRMKIAKAGYKLKKDVGTVIKNMGQVSYEDCQKLCLDFKDCDTISYCLQLSPTFGSQCITSDRYADDFKNEEMEEDFMCSIISRDYTDHFVRVPGIVLSVTAEENVKDATTDTSCARACLKQSTYQCMSFDHCPDDKDAPCRLHTVHFPNANTREALQEKSTTCGHYYKKFSNGFKKHVQTRRVGSTVPAISNMTLEECSKACIEYGKGICFGFDFCQDSVMLATSCTLFDKDPSQMKEMQSPICTSFTRVDPQYTPTPYSNSYAGGIGFLCFLIGGLIGAVIVFGIAYMRVNRG